MIEIESVETIPMHKDSIFESTFVVDLPPTPEDGGVTYDKDRWLETLGMHKQNNQMICMDTSKWVADNLPCAGFMMTPCSVVGIDGVAKTLTAKTMKVDDWVKFSDYIKESGKLFYPYMALFVPDTPLFVGYNPKTFALKQLEYPVLSDTRSHWRIRFDLI